MTSSTWVTVAAAYGPMTPGNELGPGTATVPPNSRYTWPARYALTVYIPVLNSRCIGDGPRLMPSSVQHATSAAPTGPVRTTAARLATELDDQARLRDSQQGRGRL